MLPDNRTIVALCRLLLIDPDARDWLQHTEADWLDALPGTEFLQRLRREAVFNPADAAATTLFLATLSPRESEAAHSLLADTSPTHGLTEARAAFHELKAQWLRREIAQRHARQRSGSLSPEEQLTLMAELADLSRQAKEAAAAATLARLPAHLAPF